MSDERAILSKAVAGDTAAFRALYARHRPDVTRLVFRMLGARSDLDDVVQEVFFQVFRSLKDFRGQSKFSTWLYRIAYNASISKIRKKRVEMVAIEETVITNYSTDEIGRNMNELEENDRQLILEKALQRLPEEDNLLITLFYKNENSIEDISDITGLSVSNVKVRLHRIRKKLYEEMNGLIKRN